MIGKILGAVAGAKAAEQTSKVGGAGGALLGVAAVSLFRRLSVPALIVVTAGGYALKKYASKRDAKPAEPKRAPAAKKRATPARKPAARKTAPKAAA